MKLIPLLIILTVCLSCDSENETVFIERQCTITLPTVEDIAGKPYMSVEDTKCNCRLYKVAADYIGPLSDFKPEPIDSCNLIFGYKPVPYTKLTNLMKYVRSQLPTTKEFRVPEYR